MDTSWLTYLVYTSLCIASMITLQECHTKFSENVKTYFLLQPAWRVNIKREIERHWMAHINKKLYGDILHPENSAVAVILMHMRKCLNTAFANVTTCRVPKYDLYLIGMKMCLKQHTKSKSRAVRNSLRLQLHKKFNMNLTIITFRLSSAMQCLKGKESFLVEYMDISECKKPLKSKYCKNTRMCGIFPKHTRYLISNTTDLDFSMSPSFDSKMEMILQVIDAGIITDVKMDTAYNLVDHFYEHDLFQNITFLRIHLFDELEFTYRIFRIITKRIFTLLIYSKVSHIVAYDGPGFQCRIITAQRDKQLNLFKMHSFQAMVMLHSNSSTKPLHFESSLTNFNTHRWNGSTFSKVTFPLQNCASNFTIHCVFRVPFWMSLENETSKHGVRFSVLQLTYHGPSMLGDMCIYGAVAVYYKNVNGSYDSVILHCENISKDTSKKL